MILTICIITNPASLWGMTLPRFASSRPDPKGYRSLVCRQYGLPDDRCATLGTAANMRYAVTKEACFRDLVVVAVCTGGVETNAGRAGDPAVVYECDGTYERVSHRGAGVPRHHQHDALYQP